MNGPFDIGDIILCTYSEFISDPGSQVGQLYTVSTINLGYRDFGFFDVGYKFIPSERPPYSWDCGSSRIRYAKVGKLAEVLWAKEIANNDYKSI